MHQEVRKTLWGYAPDEKLGQESLIAEKYLGFGQSRGTQHAQNTLKKRRHLKH
jgi:cobalamin-dependent methionine synthase I